MTDAQPQHIVLNFDALLEILRKAIRRSVVMMGVGLNAAEQRPHVTHILAHDGPFQMTLVEEDVTEETKDHFVDEFGKWVRANGLRELLESFSIYLHQLFFALYVIRQQVEGQPPNGLMAPDRFEGRGMTIQMDELSKLLPVDERSKRILATLNQARNCYAHRLGQVGSKDLDGGKMIVTWNRLSFSIKEPNGNVIPETEIIGRLLEEGGVVQMTVVEQERHFAVGEELVLEKKELKEICMTVLQIGQTLYNQAIQVAVDAGLMQAPPLPQQNA